MLAPSLARQRDKRPIDTSSGLLPGPPTRMRATSILRRGLLQVPPPKKRTVRSEGASQRKNCRDAAGGHDAEADTETIADQGLL
jgi:hypothetical protein